MVLWSLEDGKAQINRSLDLPRESTATDGEDFIFLFLRKIGIASKEYMRNPGNADTWEVEAEIAIEFPYFLMPDLVAINHYYSGIYSEKDSFWTNNVISWLFCCVLKKWVFF